MNFNPEIFESIFELSPNAVVVLDKSLNILNVNNAYSQITGFSKEDVIGRKPPILNSQLYEKDFFRTKLRELRKFGSFDGDLWDKTKEGELILKSLKIRELKNKEGEFAGYVEYFSDATKLKNTEENLHKIKNFNQTTGLPNRVLFESYLQISGNIAKIKKKKFGVVLVNINRFKSINESMGFDVGNELLRKAAERIKKIIIGADRVAHIGADEFAFITKIIKTKEDVLVNLRQIRDAFLEAFEIDNNFIYTSVNFGVSLYPDDGLTPNNLLRNADAALREGKLHHDRYYQFFNEDIQTKILQRREIEDQIQLAIKNREFYLEFQPKYNISSGKISGTEALIRWKKSDGVVPPDLFIPVAEETKQILEIGDWVLTESFYFAKRLQQNGISNMRVAINLSSLQLRQESFIENIKNLLQETGVTADLLEMELTERVIMENVEDNIVALNQLNELGFYISIDDFGTGYSSLSYLKWFPIHSIKIDKSFIDLITESKDDQEISKAIIALAHSLNLEVVAEGWRPKSNSIF